MVGIMTALWFGHLNGDDKVAVKPHASPVYHAIKYLTGELDRLPHPARAFGGLQAYPSRTKDPDVADFSTGSVGLGAVAPALRRPGPRYVEAHFGRHRRAALHRPRRRRRARRGQRLGGDRRPALQGLGNVMWVVDVNRQSLDRVIPGMKVHKLMQFFADSGWHVVEAKYGRGCRRRSPARAASAAPAHRRHVERGVPVAVRLRRAPSCASGSSPAPTRRSALRSPTSPTTSSPPLVQNLGGHDLGELLDAFRAATPSPTGRASCSPTRSRAGACRSPATR